MAAIVLRRCGPAIVASTLALAFAGEAPAADGYEEFHRGIYLSYVNAVGADEDITRLPLLRVSFGGPPFNIVMDTGSTGIVVSAHRIPNIDALPSLGPGELTLYEFRPDHARPPCGHDRDRHGRRRRAAHHQSDPGARGDADRVHARARSCRPNDDPRGCR